MTVHPNQKHCQILYSVLLGIQTLTAMTVNFSCTRNTQKRYCIESQQQGFLMTINKKREAKHQSKWERLLVVSSNSVTNYYKRCSASTFYSHSKGLLKFETLAESCDGQATISHLSLVPTEHPASWSLALPRFPACQSHTTCNSSHLEKRVHDFSEESK